VKPAPRLRRLQRWLDVVIRHPSTAAVAVHSRSARALFALRAVLAGEVVKPNSRMSVTDRLQVYNGGYLARLQEVLTSDYGALQNLLGEQPFARLVAAYVTAHPSRHPNLNRLGRRLPRFLAQRRGVPRHAFAVELATLELALGEAFDAPEFTPIAPEKLQRIAPEDWGRARLVCNPSLRLCAFRHPVNAYYIAWKQGKAPRPPRWRQSHVAVFRKDWRVWRLDLPAPAFAVLSAIRRGAPLGQALARARGEAAVGTWFQTWAADGLFTDVRLGRT
jgi:hypothetical protein